MTRSDVWESQIIFTPPTDPELVMLFDSVAYGFMQLLDGACVLGIRNPYADGLFDEDQELGYTVSASLKDGDMFTEVLEEQCEDVEKFRETLRKLVLELEMHRADARARAMEEHKDAAWKIQALQYSLEQEKAWSEKLEEERNELKVQLHAERRRNRQFREKRRQKSKFSSIPQNPLSQGIGAALKSKRTPRS